MRRFSSPTANAFLTPIFNACAASPMSAGSLDVDPSFLRYTHCRLPLSASNSPDPPTPRPGRTFTGCSTSAPPPSSLLLSSPLSPIENLPLVSVMSPTLYKTPVKVEVEEGILVMDGVLVSDSDLGRPRSPFSEFIVLFFFQLVTAVAIVSTRRRYVGCGRIQGSAVTVQSIRSVLSLSLARPLSLSRSIDRLRKEKKKENEWSRRR